MLYSSLIVAASAFASFAAAQNATTPIECCTIPATQITADNRTAMCDANENTCVELCGGLGDIASNGNQCDDTTLEFSCRCSNGTDISSTLNNYQQSVQGQMCNVYWFNACIAASGNSAASQRSCIETRAARCGNETTDDLVDGGNGGSTASASGTPSSTSGSPSPTTSSGTASTSAAAGAAAHVASYGMPILAGGLLAVFGLAL
ncbi:hypothetical protein ACN47E_001210 [Coniothyrium glycines]